MHALLLLCLPYLLTIALFLFFFNFFLVKDAGKVGVIAFGVSDISMSNVTIPKDGTSIRMEGQDLKLQMYVRVRVCSVVRFVSFRFR